MKLDHGDRVKLAVPASVLLDERLSKQERLALIYYQGTVGVKGNVGKSQQARDELKKLLIGGRITDWRIRKKLVDKKILPTFFVRQRGERKRELASTN